MPSKFYIPVKEISIDKDFSEWFALWLGDGDRSLKRGTIGMANQCENVIIFNMDILNRVFGLNFKRFRCEITTKEDDLNQVRDKWSKILKLPLEQIRHIQKNNMATKDCCRVFVYSELLLKELLNFEDDLLNTISNSNEDIKSAFINGIFAAEGNIRLDSKCIRIGMKNEKIIKFVSKILSDLGINSFIALNTHTNALELSIFGYNNFIRFNQIGGFGKHTDKNLNLEKQIKSYERKLPWYERFRRLKYI
ncbi:hypothetical protein J4404_00340, partial [Candidatus Woesearchaeota archaeon]|nr:hypothetical protein [Candidatus Woesearchaeota archaeon]